MSDVSHSSVIAHRSALVIASRESALAMWQAEYVRHALAAQYPQLSVKILGMTTSGDQAIDANLATIGGKGLFVKELEAALLDGRADFAVHSFKDVPMELPPGFSIVATLVREDPRDAFVSNRYQDLSELPEGAIVGTSSLRRQSQILAHYPKLTIRLLRGNVQTRLNKLDAGEYDAIILAAAGLKRLGLAVRITGYLSTAEFIPAPGQGALAIECLTARQELSLSLAFLNHTETAVCVAAERAFSTALAGNCQVPLGAHAEIKADELTLRGFVATPDGTRLLRGEHTGGVANAEAIGRELATRLIALGAKEILASLMQ